MHLRLHELLILSLVSHKLGEKPRENAPSMRMLLQNWFQHIVAQLDIFKSALIEMWNIILNLHLHWHM